MPTHAQLIPKLLVFVIAAIVAAGCTAPPHCPPTAANGQAFATPSKLVGVNNFARIADGLYRGEQPTAEGFRTLQREQHIKTIVNFRALHHDAPLLEGTSLGFIELPEAPWHPEDEDVVAFLRILRDPQRRPVFVHCQHGSDRTGCMIAVYRMVEENWSPDDAICELRRFGFHEIFADIPSYLRHLDLQKIRAELD